MRLEAVSTRANYTSPLLLRHNVHLSAHRAYIYTAAVSLLPPRDEHGRRYFFTARHATLSWNHYKQSAYARVTALPLRPVSPRHKRSRSPFEVFLRLRGSDTMVAFVG